MCYPQRHQRGGVCYSSWFIITDGICMPPARPKSPICKGSRLGFNLSQTQKAITSAN